MPPVLHRSHTHTPPPSCCPSPQVFVNEGGGRHKFFNVWPYIKPLQAWIYRWEGRAGRGQAGFVGRGVGSGQKRAGAGVGGRG